jgi:hypothetical protein
MSYEAGYNEVDTNDVLTGATYAQQLNVWTESGKKALDEVKPADEADKRVGGLLPAVDIIGGAEDGAVRVNLIGDGQGELTLSAEQFAPLVNPVDRVLIPGGASTEFKTDDAGFLSAIETANGITFKVAADKESVTQVNPDGSEIPGLALDTRAGNGTFSVTNPIDGTTQTYYNDGHFDTRTKDGEVAAYGNRSSNGNNWGFETVALDRASNTVTVATPGGESLINATNISADGTFEYLGPNGEPMRKSPNGSTAVMDSHGRVASIMRTDGSTIALEYGDAADPGRMTNFSVQNAGESQPGFLTSPDSGTILEDNTVVFMGTNGATAVLSPAGGDVFQNAEYANLERTPGRNDDTMRFLYAEGKDVRENGRPFSGLESNVGVTFNENYSIVFNGHEAWRQGSWGFYSADGVSLVTGTAPENQG